jgi:hypothetical protein
MNSETKVSADAIANNSAQVGLLAASGSPSTGGPAQNAISLLIFLSMELK